MIFNSKNCKKLSLQFSLANLFFSCDNEGVPRLKFSIFLFSFLLFTFYFFPKLAHASLFDPATSIGNSIFSGIQDAINGIFNPQSTEIGGATIPQLPAAIPTAIPGMPRPDTGDFVKLSLGWSALSLAQERVAAAQNDPLQEEHLAQINCCAGENPSENCKPQNIRHVLWGWCGQTASTSEPIPPSLGVTLTSPGPNTYTLPKAISNKYIRRDGYLFQCRPSANCKIPVACPTTSNPPCYKACPTTTNYQEFQTEIYHSNDFVLNLTVQNLTNHLIENVVVETMDLTYTPDQWFKSLPHNADYPYEVLSYAYPYWSKFAHGFNIPPFQKQIQNISFANVPPFKIGPFNLQAGESKIIPLQDEKIIRYQIPSSVEDPNTCTGATPRSSPGQFQGAISPRDFQNITYYSGSGNCKLREFLDVTNYGGCGYNASSNNSIIGPMQITATYGATGASRSLLLASLPVGGKITDDASRPFGFPANGTIYQSWGLTGLAQEQGPRRSTPGRLYTDYLYCPNQGKTYPEGRARAGNWLHPGIDIIPSANQTKPLGVYATQAGWLTFVGFNPSYPEKGVTVQIESDVNQDNLPDFATRYEHLFPGSLSLAVQNLLNPITESSQTHTFGTSLYVGRDQFLGLMGDSGSPGFTNLHYEILTNPQISGAQNGNVGVSTCTDDPYQLVCTTDIIKSFFFTLPRFENETAKAPVYTNP